MGSQDAAADLSLLDSLGITHVLNVATGIDNFFPDRFNYKRLELLDVPEERLPVQELVDFMAKEKTEAATIFVHCNAGVSRLGSDMASIILLDPRG